MNQAPLHVQRLIHKNVEGETILQGLEGYNILKEWRCFAIQCGKSFHHHFQLSTRALMGNFVLPFLHERDAMLTAAKLLHIYAIPHVLCMHAESCPGLNAAI